MSEIGFKAREDWTVADLQQFFHQLNILYNRLYVFEEFRVEKKGRLATHLDNSLSRVPIDSVLLVKSLEIHSPAEFNFQGLGEVLSQIRKLVKDLLYENRIDKGKNEEELRHAGEMNQMDEAIKRTEVMKSQIELMRQAGLPESEIQNCLRKLIDPAGKMLSIMHEKKVEVISESDR